MNKQENIQQSDPSPQPTELSTSKQILGKSWKMLTGLLAKTSNTPITGEVIGKKLLWGIGGGLLGHFSGMSFIGCLATAMTGMVFDQNIKGMGNTLMDLFQGKISFTNKSFLGPLIGGAAGFGLSAFTLHGGFLPSLLTGIGTACLTDHFLGNQKSRQEQTEKALGLSDEGQKNTGKEEKAEKTPERSQAQEVTQKLDQRQTSQRSATASLSDKELLSIAHNSPNGLEAVRRQFADISGYNDFIIRNELCDKASQENMNKFEGKPALTKSTSRQTDQTATEKALLPDNNRVKIGMG